MSGDRLARLILFSGYIWEFCLGATNLAQIVLDSTLGNKSSTVVEDRAIDPGSIVELIKNGAMRGETLFHSFEEFDVSSDRQVYFANPNGILFGENASLDLGGSFVVATADSLIFDNDAIYSASNPEPEPETSNLNYGDRVYVFELSLGQKIVVNAKDLFKAAQSESINSLTNSSNK